MGSISLNLCKILHAVNKWLSTLIARATEKMMKQKDERIRRAGEMLTYIRTLKMYGWEVLFADHLRDARSLEVKYLSTRKYLDAWCVFFWATTPTLFSVFTFGLFSLTGHPLNAATVFTCVALFNILISPLNSFPWVINGLIDAFISARRLSTFLACPEHRSKRVHIVGKPSTSVSEGQVDCYQETAIAILDASCAWSYNYEEKQDLVLNRITIELPKGLLIAVIGEVGSGKSSLLNSVLGETQLIRGSIGYYGSIAYVSQVSWIFSGTIRDNILFGNCYDAKRYSEVLVACALNVDISLMIGGDQSYIGEKGVNLSGGQKARLALARALYHGADIFLLDDVLSAVDAQAISSADMIVVMDKGYVKWTGSLAEFTVSQYSRIISLNNSILSPTQRLTEERSTHLLDNSEHFILPDEDPSNISKEIQVDAESRKEGRVELDIYKNYAEFSSWSVTIVILLSAFLMQASRNGNDLWLSFWVDTTAKDEKYSTSFYLTILGIFCIVNSFLTLVRAFSFAFGGLHAALRVHTELLNKLINAPVCFFDQTPSGRILNRFSSDLYTIDDSLPFILNILLANFVGILGILIVLSYVQFYYRATSRELRRLDSVARSPIYSSFSETLEGSPIIRSFRAEERQLARFIEHIALYQQTSYTEQVASSWLSLRLQLLAAFIISFVGVMAVIGCRGDLPVSFGTPGLVGLSLSYAVPFVSQLSSFLSSFTETEKEMVSVERVLQYMDVPQEDLHGCQSLLPGWPFEGKIEFQNVTLQYMPYLPAALLDVTFTIAGGTQVGIIGRTGAGKSSILNALFRLTPLCGGFIFVDGLDVTHIPVRDLRSHFAVVPQMPFLFEGSLRDNLDPYGALRDAKIWEVLEKCHIKDEVMAAGGLDFHIKEGGISFSVGQRQLICLARALLKSSKVLCLDECSANVDTQTALVLQNAIYRECGGMTVITIAHRISTVLNMDNILILEQGLLVEEGSPKVLLQDECSRFSSFAKASTM
ncbi:hypothetical protein Scep_008603 [Stephania cephalantha]|uniref:ABC transporter C family member 13 n=1 Tax=Stephania cephalantha TaxID=152367 RepID=A0AAP0PR36_9MAGN